MTRKKFPAPFLFLLLLFGAINVAFSQVIPGRYIVVLKDNVGNPRSVASDIGRAHGFQADHVYSYAIKGFAAAIPDVALASVKNNPNVAYVEPDGIAHGSGQTLPTGVDRIDADRNAISKIDGIDERVDVDIAILDTGVDLDHPDLNVVEAVNFTTYGPDDRYGHGTHVAGSTAALDNGFGVVGVAPGARIHAVKVLGDDNWGYWSDIIEGIDWVTQHASTIEVANMSIIGVGRVDSLRTAIQNNVAQGVIYVVCAGNNSKDVYGDDGVFNTSDDQIPAAYPEVATISAMSDASNTFASFTNFSRSVIPGNPVVSSGAAIDLAAPGVAIYSTYKDGSYATWSGTSMASPHVAGLAALYIAKNGRGRNATEVANIRQALIDMAEPQSIWGTINTGDADANPERLGDAEPIAPLNANNPPKVAITNLINGQVISGSYSVKVSASDTDGTIATVELSIDSANFINITANFDGINYNYDWNTTAVSEGPHTVDARAIDDKGATTKASQITVTVDNIDGPPVVTFMNPMDGSIVSKIVLIQIFATDDRGINSAAWAIDTGTFQPMTFNRTTGCWEASWDTAQVTDGPHTVSAQATDTGGQTSTNSVGVTADNTAPTVVVTNPLYGVTVSGTVTIQMDATDNMNAAGTLTVDCAIDAGAWQPAVYNSTSGKYEASWDTTKVANSSHTIDAQAKNSGGNIGTANQILVTVFNDATGANANNMYVWVISWQESYTGKNASQLDLKVQVNIRRDSNVNGKADDKDVGVGSASVIMVLTWAGKDGNFGTGDDSSLSLTGLTDRKGNVAFTWKNAPLGQYKTEVTNLTHNTYVWKKNLDADNPDFFTTAKLAAPALARSDMMNQPTPPIQLMNHTPPKTRLRANFPNPFNPETWIAYELAEDVNVSIQIYDVTGRRVRTLDLGQRAAGYYVDRAKAAYWDGRNDVGERVASGVYLYRLTAGNYAAMRRMLILK